MSQRSSIIYNLINSPAIYKLIQKIMMGTSLEKIIENNIKKENLNILDIGCGPAEVIDNFPHSNYYGFDIDKRSIQYAKKNILKVTFIFIVKSLKKVS